MAGIRSANGGGAGGAGDDGWGDHPIGGPHSKYPPKRTGHVLT